MSHLKPTPAMFRASVQALSIFKDWQDSRSILEDDGCLFRCEANEASDRLIELCTAHKQGAMGNVFVTNRREGWTSQRVQTIHIQGRVVAAVVDHDGDDYTVYVASAVAQSRKMDLANGPGAWARALVKVERRRAGIEYAANRAIASRAIEAICRGTLDGVPRGFRFDPGQNGGTLSWLVNVPSKMQSDSHLRAKIEAALNAVRAEDNVWGEAQQRLYKLGGYPNDVPMRRHGEAIEAYFARVEASGWFKSLNAEDETRVYVSANGVRLPAIKQFDSTWTWSNGASAEDMVEAIQSRERPTFRVGVYQRDTEMCLFEIAFGEAESAEAFLREVCIDRLGLPASGPALEPVGLFATEIVDIPKHGGVTRGSTTAELVAALLGLHEIDLADGEELVAHRATRWFGDEDMG